jgi:hypothetical protein
LVAERPTPTETPINGPKALDVLEPRRLTATELSYVDEAQRFICSQPVTSSDRVEVLYGLARIYYEAKHWDEAAELFHTVAELPDASLAPYAAQISLECIDALATYSRSGCFDLISERTTGYLEVFCGANTAPNNGETCANLRTVERFNQLRPRGKGRAGRGK